MVKNRIQHNLIKTSLFIFNLLLCINLTAQDLELQLINNKTVYELGDEVELKLNFLDLNTELVVENNENIKIIDIANFSKKIVVIANTVGNFNIGPYIVTIGNKEIKSNTQRITVIDNKIITEQDREIIIEVPREVNKGDKFSIKVISSKNLLGIVKGEKGFPEFNNLNIKSNKYINQLSSSTSSSTSIKNGVMKSEFIYTLILIAKRKGSIAIQRELFIPELDIDFETKIIIKKP